MSRGGVGNIERSTAAISPQYNPDDNIPEISILLLGDADVGKSTFLSRLSLGTSSSSPSPSSNPNNNNNNNNSSSISDNNLTNPSTLSTSSSTTTLTTQQQAPPPPPYNLPLLRDENQPFTFQIRMYNRHYRFLFQDTASPTSYLTLRPHFVILCYDVSRRSTLLSLSSTWKRILEEHFNYDEMLPVMMVGLKRDLRREWPKKKDGEEKEEEEEEEEHPDARSVMPQEGVRIAQEMRCDRYAECSAVTGELCREVLEDVARMAAKTTTAKGAKTEGSCVVS